MNMSVVIFSTNYESQFDKNGYEIYSIQELLVITDSRQLINPLLPAGIKDNPSNSVIYL